MTASERKANIIAQMLIKALKAIEKFDDDPQMILDSAVIYANKEGKGVKESIAALDNHYNGK